MDSTFEFERRRNVPVRYDRELMGATLAAMRRVSAIQKARDDRFYQTRMRGREAMERAEAAMEIAQNIDLVAPAVTRQTAELNVVETARAVERTTRKKAEKMVATT